MSHEDLSLADHDFSRDSSQQMSSDKSDHAGSQKVRREERNIFPVNRLMMFGRCLKVTDACSPFRHAEQPEEEINFVLFPAFSIRNPIYAGFYAVRMSVICVVFFITVTLTPVAAAAHKPQAMYQGEMFCPPHDDHGSQA